MDKDFVAATIQAIGRCATNIGKVRDTCLNGLVQLLSNRDGKSLFEETALLGSWGCKANVRCSVETEGLFGMDTCWNTASGGGDQSQSGQRIHEFVFHVIRQQFSIV